MQNTSIKKLILLMVVLALINTSINLSTIFCTNTPPTQTNDKGHVVTKREKFEMGINYINTYYSYQEKKIAFETKLQCLKNGCISRVEIALLKVELEREESKLILIQQQLNSIYKKNDEELASLKRLVIYTNSGS